MIFVTCSAVFLYALYVFQVLYWSYRKWWHSIFIYSGYYDGLAAFFNLMAALLFLTAVVFYLRSKAQVIHESSNFLGAMITLAVLFSVGGVCAIFETQDEFKWNVIIPNQIANLLIQVVLFALVYKTPGHSTIKGQVSQEGDLEILGIDHKGYEVFKYRLRDQFTTAMDTCATDDLTTNLKSSQGTVNNS